MTAGFVSPFFLRRQAKPLTDFYLPRRIDTEIGGFITQIADGGSIFDRQTRHLVGSCRYTNSFTVGDQYGLCNGEDCLAAEHGLRFLREAHRDSVKSGFWQALSGRDPIDHSEHASGHAFVLLTASTAITRELKARDIFEDVSEILETRFWREENGLYVDEISEDSAVVDPYRVPPLV